MKQLLKQSPLVFACLFVMTGIKKKKSTIGKVVRLCTWNRLNPCSVFPSRSSRCGSASPLLLSFPTDGSEMQQEARRSGGGKGEGEGKEFQVI